MAATRVWRTVAAALLGLEGVALAIVVVGELAALLAGGGTALDSGVALTILTAVGAAAVLLFAVATARGRSWGRSGGIVVQLLILAVAVGAATGAYADPAIGLALAVPAVVTVVVLILAARAAARSEGPARPHDGTGPDGAAAP